MKKDKDWTKTKGGVLNKIANGILYTVIPYHKIFVKLTKYSLHTDQVIQECTFFIQPLDDNCINDKYSFWNCKNIYTAIQLAKYWVNHGEPYEMLLEKDDINWFSIKKTFGRKDEQ